MSYSYKCDNCGSPVETETTSINCEITCKTCEEHTFVPLTNLVAGMVSGSYWIQRKIGSGNISEVFVAKHTETNSKVFLKVLSPCVTPDKEPVEQFLVDMCRTHQVDHPGVLKIIETGKMAGHYYIATDYVDGRSLDQLIAEKGPLSEKMALKSCLQAARVMRKCWHEHGIMHYSLSPSNVLLTDDDKTVLLDIGNNKQHLLSPQVTLERMNNLGTLQTWMSPEQAEGIQELSFSSDMYSLGATMFFMLTGKAPYADTVPTTAEDGTEQYPKISEQLPDGLSEKTVEIVEQMLELYPEERFQSWHELVDQLKECLMKYTAGEHTQATLATQLMKKPQLSEAEAEYLAEIDRKGLPKGIFWGIAGGILLLVTMFGVIGYYGISQLDQNKKPVVKDVQEINGREQILRDLLGEILEGYDGTQGGFEASLSKLDKLRKKNNTSDEFALIQNAINELIAMDNKGITRRGNEVGTDDMEAGEGGGVEGDEFAEESTEEQGPFMYVDSVNMTFQDNRLTKKGRRIWLVKNGGFEDKGQYWQLASPPLTSTLDPKHVRQGKRALKFGPNASCFQIDTLPEEKGDLKVMAYAKVDDGTGLLTVDLLDADSNVLETYKRKFTSESFKLVKIENMKCPEGATKIRTTFTYKASK